MLTGNLWTDVLCAVAVIAAIAFICYITGFEPASRILPPPLRKPETNCLPSHNLELNYSPATTLDIVLPGNASLKSVKFIHGSGKTREITIDEIFKDEKSEC